MRSLSNQLLRLALCCVAMVCTGALGEPLRLPRIFGDHMVLQRDLPVIIWGWADAGQTVSIVLASQEKSTKANDHGQWRIELDPLQTNRQGSTLQVKAGDQTIEFTDVLVGEVWLCSGQSNMEWRVRQSDGADQEIANADCPLIRHIEIDHVMLPEPQDDVASKKGWEVCTPETVPSFTAAGYFFGRELFDHLDVPIGLVNSCWGGSNIEAFTSLEGFKQVPSLSEYVDRIEASSPDHPAYRRAVTETMAATQQWLTQAEDYELVFSFDIGAGGTTQKKAVYRVDRSAEIDSFNRVAYCLVLKKADGPLQYVWAAMNPFVQQAAKVGIPTIETGVTFRQAVQQMTVQPNVPGVINGEGMEGYIEFWPNNYNAMNSDGVSNASDEAFDFGDTPVSPREGYGSMQIHNPSAKQTVMAINKWQEGLQADVGIGNSPTGNPDYTFRNNAGDYQLKRLMVLVRAR